MTDDGLCGAWMPRAQAYCAEKADHKGQHRSAEQIAKRRKQQREYNSMYRDTDAKNAVNKAYMRRVRGEPPQ